MRRRLKDQGWIFGRFVFRHDGLWFRPYRLEEVVVGLAQERLVGWEETVAVDVTGGFFGGGDFIAFRADREPLSGGLTNRDRFEWALRSVGFEPHEHRSWPDHRLHTRPAQLPNWDLLLDVS